MLTIPKIISLVALLFWFGGCAEIGNIEAAAQERAKRPIMITVYHGKF